MHANWLKYILAATVITLLHFAHAAYPSKKEVQIRKYGPYIGIEKGAYLLPKLGVECQWKTVGLFRSGQTHAIHTGLNYNLGNAIMGYDLGYWTKSGAFGLTYGGTLNYRSDFTKGGFGVTPVVGFKWMQFHVETGYSFYSSAAKTMHVNKLFIGIRFVLVRDRKVSLN